MNARTKIEQVMHGDEVHLPRNGRKIICCDCGLSHWFTPRVDARGRVYVRVERDDRSTAGVRRARPLRGVAKAIKSGGQT